MANVAKKPEHYVNAITSKDISIYDDIPINDPDLWIPSLVLKELLDKGLVGLSVKNLPIRTRSKVVKTKICNILGYPAPESFRKTRPRFPGQNFDTYIQKSNNLQIWNESVSANRRYVIVKVSNADVIEKVTVISGEKLAELDTTGTLTIKYQARLVPRVGVKGLLTGKDTDNVRPLLKSCRFPTELGDDPIADPDKKTLLPIKIVFKRLSRLVGKCFEDTGAGQERTRGSLLHRLVCEGLGYSLYRNGGLFPDVRNQLLEVKLQTSPTIDLGLVLPSSDAPLDIPVINGHQLRYCDSRFAIFSASIVSNMVVLEKLYVTTGEKFFNAFEQFEGKVVNKKIQINLPDSLFND
jgi:hypothetical protein